MDQELYETLFEILFRRKNRVLQGLYPHPIHVDNSITMKQLVATMDINLRTCGYKLHPDVLREIENCYFQEEFFGLYDVLMTNVLRQKGADKNYHPMYPNFPRQVMEMDESELYFNAVLHYASYGRLMPNSTPKKMIPLLDNRKLIEIDWGHKEDLYSIADGLMQSKTNLSSQDQNDLMMILKMPKYNNPCVDEIPLKENVALVFKALVEKEEFDPIDYTKKYVKTATDILRIIVGLSDGDISLSRPSRIKHFDRKTRRMIMNMLAAKPYNPEDFFRYREQWLRVFEILHPFDDKQFKAKRFAPVRHICNRLYHNDKPESFIGKANELYDNGLLIECAQHLSQRPGEFARWIDRLLRAKSCKTFSGDEYSHRKFVIQKFQEVAKQVSTPVLLQLMAHITKRCDENGYRVVMPKGGAANIHLLDKPVDDIPKDVCMAIYWICDSTLLDRFCEKDPMGKVYIDPALMKFLIPSNQRSASDAKKILTRGSRIEIPKDRPVIRPFIWWTNMDDRRVDIDLSCVIYDKDWNYLGHCSYTRLKNERFEIYHSGDIVNGGLPDGPGAAEFIDFNIDEVYNHGGKYVAVEVYSYIGYDFSEMENCQFGFMTRNDINSGEIFEPKTVENIISLSAKSNNAIPAIFDCETHEMIWADVTGSLSRPYQTHLNNLEDNLYGATKTCYAICNMNKASLYSLIELNGFARGEFVNDPNYADIIFSNEIYTDHARTITAYDIDYIVSDLF